ncbi:phosphopantetheine-binding protein [Mesorhizobium sp. CO1-1-8]|uniref:phosphopantetheine-binding protein n=1 Tax=Mesorhizobium sp. CO1-1-8 TaxID=2876631 RepID=UPI001CD0D20E|nr:phosphopantetheine-binding protein [Mesorhizobium sp. CO1-1-8]MBZ9770998.1 phosphopantetheine-binding protein [Mesorhizobium sp. CO1-1-8]
MVETVLFRCVGKTAAYLSSVSLDDRLVDLEFDSLRFIQLVVQLENALGVVFDDEKLDPAQFERMSDLLAYLETLAPKAANARGA